MTQSRRRFLTIAAGFAAWPTLDSPARAAAPAWTGVALGAEASITLNGPTDRTGAALRDAVTTLRRLERVFSLYDPGSSLAQLNTHGTLANPDPALCALLQQADQVHVATSGRFDPTIQPLWRALAEGRDPGAAIDALGWARVRRSPHAIALDPGQALTLNGIAQGYVTDCVRVVLRRHGFNTMLVNIGEFAADGGPWRLGVADPVHGLVMTRSLQGGAMATSSPGAMRLGRSGCGHILGPSGQAPLWSTISVEADTATLADAVSTALCLADRAAIHRIKLRLPGVRRVTAIDADGNIATF